MASVSPGSGAANMDPQGQGHHHNLFSGGSVLPGPGRVGGGGGGGGGGGSGYYVSTSDGASTCSSSTTEAGEGDSLGGSGGGTLLVLEPKSLRSFETNDEYLYAMQEDLADWFSCLYQTEVTADSFFTALETGVLLCKHANKVQGNARQMRERGETLEMRSYFIRSVPERAVPYRENVKPETFQARDNISNFISWGRQLGIPEVLSFETDDLVLRKNEKSVILCLLELARVGAKLGMLAPTLVQMEEEIDAELAGEEAKPQVQIKTCDMRSLEERVRDLIGRCTCPIQFPMIKVADGKYKIGDSRSLIFVRILRNHVMVRVGGGWDTLENYLNKHDPCQCNYKGHRAGTAQTAHKVQVSQSQQQRRASTPGGNSAYSLPPGGGGAGGGGASTLNTPTSPRRMSSAAPLRHRSVSPQQSQQATGGSAASSSVSSSTSAAATKHNPPRSKSPTLIISRHTPSGGSGAGLGGGNKSKGAVASSRNSSNTSSTTPSFSVSRVSSHQTAPRGEGVVSKSWSQPLSRFTANNNTNNSNTSNNDSAHALSSQPNRCKSPSPGRLRSPSPLNAGKSTLQSPTPFNRTASGSSLVKGKGPEQRVSTPRRLPGSSMISDNEEEDENESYQADEDDFEYDNEEAEDSGEEGDVAEVRERGRARRTVNKVEPGYGFADDVSDSGHGKDEDEEQETPLDRLFSSVGSRVYTKNGVNSAVNYGTPGTALSAVSEVPQTAATTAVTATATTTTSVLSSLPKRTMVHPARRALEEREYCGGVFRSVSFDERAEWNYDQRSSSSSLDRVNEHETNGERTDRGGGGGGGGDGEGTAGDKSSVSMDKISTMTLTEFKSLLNSSLSVPENQQTVSQNGLSGGSSARSPAGSSDSSQHPPNWDSLREKARSVRDSISNSVSNRRAAGNVSGARRSLPQSPDDPDPPSSFERPKTPQALRRNRNSSSGRTSPVSRPKTPTSVSRPKTPTSYNNSRPKTPTSGIARPKTPTSAPREEYRMARPKTPSQVKRDAVAKVAGAISNWVDSRPDVTYPDCPSSAPSRPKTPTSRPKTPTRQQANRRWMADGVNGEDDGDADVDDDFDDEDENAELSGLHASRAVPAVARERPSTPSRIPKPCFTARPTTPKLSSIPVPVENSSSSVLPDPALEKSHTAPTTSSSLSSQEQDIILRQQQLQRLQRELEEAQQRAEEDRRRQEQQKAQQEQENEAPQQRHQSHASRPNFLPTRSVSRSDSNASSVKSPGEYAPSPAASMNGDRSSIPKTKIAVSRKLPLARGSSEDSGNASWGYREIHSTRRCVTPGPGSGEQRAQPSRAVTPGPREKWSIGGQNGRSAGYSKAPQQRRGSLNTGSVTVRDPSSWQGVPARNGNNMNVHSNNNQQALINNEVSFTNEITFSDDEEINELVRNTALMNGARTGVSQTAENSRVRSASVDARRLERQTARRNSKGGEEVLMIHRDDSGGHAVQVLSNNSNSSVNTANRDRSIATGIMRRPQRSQGNATSSKSTTATAPSSATNTARFRSQTPDPSMFRQKLAFSKPAGARPTTPSADSRMREAAGTGKSFNRTEAWVDSTLSDPKRKLPSKPRRARGGVAGDISANELAPRPLEEIQAMLSTPRDVTEVGGADLDAPPEDPEMFKKMEKLFEKYREMELRASVNETPGGPPVQATSTSKGSSDAQSSGRPGSLKSSGGGASSYGKPPVSLRTSSSGSHVSSSVRVSSSGGERVTAMRQNSSNSADPEDPRYRRASSVPHQYRSSASATTSALNSPSVELREFSGQPGTGANAAYNSNRNRAISQGEADQTGIEKSLRDIDPETAKNPTALITKIKEILKVRPRKDENSQVARTRIPAPSSLTRASRSKSVSNLFSSSSERGEAPSLSMSTSGRGVLKHTSSSNTGSRQGSLNRANSGSSGNISYTEFVFNDEEESIDNVPEMSKAWSVKSDSSDSQTRCETPVPKLATPLTTGRSTLISRMGRSLSQDKENNLSNSQTSLSNKSAFSTTEEDADYV